MDVFGGVAFVEVDREETGVGSVSEKWVGTVDVFSPPPSHYTSLPSPPSSVTGVRGV